jgi:hypothetical protein
MGGWANQGLPRSEERDMSLAQLHAAAAAQEKGHALPPGALAGILQDLLQILLKWAPALLGQPSAGNRTLALHRDVANLEAQRSLPPGTILKIIQSFGPVLIQLLPVLLGGSGGGSVPAPVPPTP